MTEKPKLGRNDNPRPSIVLGNDTDIFRIVIEISRRKSQAIIAYANLPSNTGK